MTNPNYNHHLPADITTDMPGSPRLAGPLENLIWDNFYAPTEDCPDKLDLMMQDYASWGDFNPHPLDPGSRHMLAYYINLDLGLEGGTLGLRLANRMILETYKNMTDDEITNSLTY